MIVQYFLWNNSFHNLIACIKYNKTIGKRNKVKLCHLLWLSMQAGYRLTHSEAFPIQREIASRWNRWHVVSGGGIPRCCPWSQPMLLMVWMASSLQPPKDSTTRGMKVTRVKCEPSLNLEYGHRSNFCKPKMDRWVHFILGPLFA